jgi:hypothetical protein
MSAQTPTPTVFDLSATEAADHLQQRKTRLGMNVVLGVLMLMGVVAFVYSAPALVHRWGQLASSTTGLETIALFFSAVAYELVVGYLLYLSLRHGGRAPVKLEIGADGIALYWADGSRREWKWARLHGALTLDDLSINGLAVQAQLRISLVGFCVMTKAACDGIESAARTHGMSVSVAEYPRTGMSYAKRSITIRSQARAAPHHSLG